MTGKRILTILSILALAIPSVSFGATYTYGYTGSVGSYTVPSGVTKLKVTVYGAQGGSGGSGGQSYGEIIVSNGTTYYYNVGGQGTTGASPTGGYNGGGNAGNAGSLNGGGGGGM